MHVAAIIQARMTSTRFPGKVLKPIAGKPVLWHVVYRLRKCRMVNTIILATTTNRADDPLYDFAKEERIAVFRGSEDNVLERYYMAAKEFKADVILRVTGDAPLIDPYCIDLLLTTLIEQGGDRAGLESDKPLIHEGFSPFTFQTLQRLVHEVGDDPVAREHVDGYFHINPDFASVSKVKIGPEHQFSGARVSTDTPADLRFLEEIYRRLQVPPGEADILEVIKLLTRERDLLNINSFVYQKKADDPTRWMLFRCDANERVGFGHLMRCMALAEELRDSTGCGIVFAMASGKHGFQKVQEEGFHLITLDPKNEEAELGTIIQRIKADAIVFDSRNPLELSALQQWREDGKLIVTIDDPTTKRLVSDLAFYPPVPQLKTMSWDGFSGQLFAGWEWVILRKEFAGRSFDRGDKAKDKPLIMITMGGSDPKGLTLMAVESIERIKVDCDISVLIGPGFSHGDSLDSLLKKCRRKFRVLSRIDEPGSFFTQADIAIASFGVTAYELAATGTPSILLSISEDHALSASVFDEAGIALNLGMYTDIEVDTVTKAVNALLEDQQRRKYMSDQARLLVDGKGAERIAKIITRNLNCII